MAPLNYVKLIHYPSPAHTLIPRERTQITDLIVHHTAGALTQTPSDIDAEHRNTGDSMIAYHIIVTPDGSAYWGRPLDAVGAATYGRNTESVNVCLVGNFQTGDAGYTGPPTNAQLATLEKLVLDLHKMLPSIVRTIGHRDVATLFFGGDGNYATACPGTDLYARIPEIKQRVVAHLNIH